MIDTITQAGWCLPVWKQMAEMRTATVAKELNAATVISVQRIKLYAVVCMDPKGRKAATGRKLF